MCWSSTLGAKPCPANARSSLAVGAQRFDVLAQHCQAVRKVLGLPSGFTQDLGAKRDEPGQLRVRDRQMRGGVSPCLRGGKRVELLQIMAPHLFAP